MATEDYERNRLAWDATSDAYQARHGRRLTESREAWGIWRFAESDLQLLGEVAGRDVLEYGCGGAQWAIALASRAARCVALDNSARQLEHARRNVEAAGVDVRLAHAPAERTPFGDASFDVVFCDHGAMSFADPEIAIPEVARILRPGGVFAFCRQHPIHEMLWDASAQAPSRSAQRGYFAVGRSVDPADGGVQFVATIGTYVALLVASGFVVEKLLEPRPSLSETTTYDTFASLEWARDFPSELMIRARKGA